MQIIWFEIIGHHPNVQKTAGQTATILKQLFEIVDTTIALPCFKKTFADQAYGNDLAWRFKS